MKITRSSTPPEQPADGDIWLQHDAQQSSPLDVLDDHAPSILALLAVGLSLVSLTAAIMGLLRS